MQPSSGGVPTRQRGFPKCPAVLGWVAAGQNGFLQFAEEPIFVRQRRQSLVYQPMSDEDFVLAVVGIVGALAAVFLPIFFHRLRRRRAEGDVHDYVRELERRTVAQPTRKAEADEVGNLSLEAGFVWLEANATVSETDAICERLSAMEIGYGVRQMHIDKAFHGIYTTGGGLGTKMGIYVKESDYEQARPIAERIMQGESLASRSRIG